MDALITDVFNDECKHLEIDTKFIRRIHQFQVDFINKNEEHIAFFGGHLLGVHKVRFTPSDENYWFEDLLETNSYLLKDRLHKLPGINPEFIVSSDIFNISSVWLVHAIFISKKLTERQKEEAMIDVMLIMNYRFITSRLSHYFRWPADPAVAEETYNRLSYKFAIKVHKTWYNVLRNRAIDIISKNSIHYETITKLNSNEGVVIMINDCQGRIRDMIKNIYDVLKQTSDSGIKIVSTSDVANSFDGASILKDKINGLTTYTQYIKANISDKNSFIKDDLVKVIERIMSTMPPKLFTQVLEWVSENYGKTKTNIIEEAIDEILVHSFDYLAENRSLLRNTVDLVGLLGKLKGVYTSSRSNDPSLLLIREKCEEIAFLATNNKNKNIIPSLRTGLMLYIVSRTFTKSYYS